MNSVDNMRKSIAALREQCRLLQAKHHQLKEAEDKYIFRIMYYTNQLQNMQAKNIRLQNENKNLRRSIWKTEV